jgi:hypothetical protein
VITGKGQARQLRKVAAEREAFDKINDIYSTARDLGASHDLAWDLAKRSVGDDRNAPASLLDAA